MPCSANCSPIDRAVEEHRIIVPRTARYYTLGEAVTTSELWLVLHGYGQLARYFLRPFEGLEQNRLIAAPEALSRFYTDEAHSRVGATWMTREDREAEISDQGTYLNTLAAALLAPCRPGTPLNVLGFSQGVATACRWTLRSTTPIRRLVLWSGSMPPEMEAGTMRGAWSGSKITLVHGEHDLVTTEEVLQRNTKHLREAGLAHGTLRFNGGHQLDRVALGKVLDP